MPSTTIDSLAIERAVLAVAGPQALAGITAPLTDEQLARLDAILTEHAPAHLLAMRALNADGSIVDRQAFDEMIATAGGEHTDTVLDAEVTALLAKYGVTA